TGSRENRTLASKRKPSSEDRQLQRGRMPKLRQVFGACNGGVMSASHAVMADVVQEVSLYEEAHAEALRHKWIESQKHGRDLGDWAIRDWYRRYWRLYCRCCRV